MNVIGKTLRTRLKVELVVYRVEQVYVGRDEDGDQWDELDTDVTAELVLDEGTVLRGELIKDEKDEKIEHCVWHEQSPAQREVEGVLQALADRCANVETPSINPK